MNELKQDIETDQELLLWKIMVMKFMFTHRRFPLRICPSFPSLLLYMKLCYRSDHGIAWVLTLHFVLLKLWILVLVSCCESKK